MQLLTLVVQQDILLCIQSCAFPIARPVWGEPLDVWHYADHYAISTHSPRVGRTRVRYCDIVSASISTHSPRVGRTFHELRQVLRDENFNSLAPRGANRVGIAEIDLVSIRNYIALKRTRPRLRYRSCLVSIRNYIALKQVVCKRTQTSRLVSIRNYIVKLK